MNPLTQPPVFHNFNSGLIPPVSTNSMVIYIFYLIYSLFYFIRFLIEKQIVAMLLGIRGVYDPLVDSLVSSNYLLLKLHMCIFH